MNRAKLKTYAPQARRDFIQAMKDRAAFFGITNDHTEPVVERGDVAVIAGREHPRLVARKRRQLDDRIKKHQFEHTMEELAYTWFNRLVAIRFMELHGYLEHGFRVLSHPDGKSMPQILEHAEHVELPGLRRESVIDLKLAANKEPELYRLLLIAQCNALHTAMPFLFEKLDDETELLLPENLLHSDSLIRKLVNEIDEDDWKEVEIIGWLYQFYISDKKDEVIGSVVASEDIPAATQLFTPNWIVKYLVQNTLGRQWLATYPQSALRQQMQFYIEPTEQTPLVQEQLKAITPSSLNPEELTLLDPACGSGHILVEAYDLFKSIYQERGYRAKDIPTLILQNNLFGLEIDDRAAQLAAFALMMKARADDRRIFDGEAKPNILAFVDSQGMNVTDITHALNSPINKDDKPSEHLFEEIEEEKAGLFSKKVLAEKGYVSQADIAALLGLFENASTFGSLIQVPPMMAAKLPEIEKRLNDVLRHAKTTTISVHEIKPLLHQSRLLARQYDAIVANPPYMGSKGMNSQLKSLAKQQFPKSKSDLFAVFSERVISFVHSNQYVGLMTPFTWMFIKSYEHMRSRVSQENTLISLIQPEYHAFFESAFVPICAFVFQKVKSPQLTGTFIGLSDFYGEDTQPIKALEAIRDGNCSWRHSACSLDFQKIPGNPIAYWVSRNAIDSFLNGKPLHQFAVPRAGMITGDNARFVRLWYEVSVTTIGFRKRNRDEALVSCKKWFPYQKGGEFRKWYGNFEFVVNWENDGFLLRTAKDADGKVPAHAFNDDYIFKPNVNWSAITSSHFSARISLGGSHFDASGSAAFPACEDVFVLAGFLNSSVARYLLQAINPTLNFQAWNIGNLPIPHSVFEHRARIDIDVEECYRLAEEDWNSLETSWEFSALNSVRIRAKTIREAQDVAAEQCHARISRMKQLEEENNRLFIEAYGLQEEIAPAVADDQITLYRPDRVEETKRLISYAIGCMMGRYNLDKPGLIYANSGNQDFDSSHYKTFRADDDGIIPVLETDWGIADDAANRIVEFVAVAWPKENLEENLKFIAGSLGPNNGENPRATIRRYLATGFYKYHLAMYKKRPIYWLFSSGKQRAFQCLVYLHRYNEGTLARMRTEYVIPLMGKIKSRMEQLVGTPKTEGKDGEKEGGYISSATSTSQRRKLQKEYDELKKQLEELSPIDTWHDQEGDKGNRKVFAFDEKLKNAADMQIRLDLDDGVKANYGKFSDPKFGEILAEVKGITGGKDDE